MTSFEVSFDQQLILAEKDTTNNTSFRSPPQARTQSQGQALHFDVHGDSSASCKNKATTKKKKPATKKKPPVVISIKKNKSHAVNLATAALNWKNIYVVRVYNKRVCTLL